MFLAFIFYLVASFILAIVIGFIASLIRDGIADAHPFSSGLIIRIFGCIIIVVGVLLAISSLFYVQFTPHSTPKHTVNVPYLVYSCVLIISGVLLKDFRKPKKKDKNESSKNEIVPEKEVEAALEDELEEQEELLEEELEEQEEEVQDQEEELEEVIEEQDKVYCRYCGALIPSDSAFCSKCGKKL